MSWDRLRASYDRVALGYEQEFSAELDGKPYDQRILDAFATAAADPVIEIGCGPGQVGAYLRAHGRRVLGLDLSTQMSRLAAARLDGAAAADMRELPLADWTAGGLVAFYSVIHVRRQELGALLGEFRRVLKPGGRLLISAHEGEGEFATDVFMGQPVPFIATLYRLDELSGAADGAGLTVVSAQRRPPYPAEYPTNRLYIEARRIDVQPRR